MSGKASQEVAFDPGTLIPTCGSSSPLFLGGGVGVLKDNGKGKAVRRLNLRQLNLLRGSLGTAMDQRQLAAALDMCSPVPSHNIMVWTGCHSKRLSWKSSSPTPPPLNCCKYLFLITQAKNSKCIPIVNVQTGWRSPLTTIQFLLTSLERTLVGSSNSSLHACTCNCWDEKRMRARVDYKIYEEKGGR